MKRKEFIRKLVMLGGTGLFVLSGGSLLLQACAPLLKEDEEAGEETWRPAYAKLAARGELNDRVQKLYEIMESCELCPRRCRVNRLAGERGFCQAPGEAVVYSHQPHFGEELPLVGQSGSGTIFFSNCNLRCVFCQNWPIAHEGWGSVVSDEELAEMMLSLQQMGCHNINLVTPTHVLPNIVSAVQLAMDKGLHLPLCYNTSGYELVSMIKMLGGVIDIYLPDFKFMDGDEAERYNLASAYDYPEKAMQSIAEMHRQVGDIVTDERGIALNGLMVRHLVMPNRVAGTEAFARWVAEELSTETYVNIMAQYRVDFKAFEYDEIARAITSEEFIEAIEWAKNAGLTNLDKRSLAQYEVHLTKVN